MTRLKTRLIVNARTKSNIKIRYSEELYYTLHLDTNINTGFIEELYSTLQLDTNALIRVHYSEYVMHGLAQC